MATVYFLFFTSTWERKWKIIVQGKNKSWFRYGSLIIKKKLKMKSLLTQMNGHNNEAQKID